MQLPSHDPMLLLPQGAQVPHVIPQSRSVLQLPKSQLRPEAYAPATRAVSASVSIRSVSPLRVSFCFFFRIEHLTSITGRTDGRRGNMHRSCHRSRNGIDSRRARSGRGLHAGDGSIRVIDRIVRSNRR